MQNSKRKNFRENDGYLSAERSEQIGKSRKMVDLRGQSSGDETRIILNSILNIT
jgi:hypothetical protein